MPVAQGSCAEKRISDICYMRSRFMFFAYLNCRNLKRRTHAI